MEGQNIFNILTGVAITILVKNNKKSCSIMYSSVDNYMSREEKLNMLKVNKSIKNIKWKDIIPDNYYDWINHRSELFNTFIPIEPRKKKDISSKSFFSINSNGVVTNRDDWACNYSVESLSMNMQNMISFYNKEVDKISKKRQELGNIIDIEKIISTDLTKIKWVQNLIQDANKEIKHSFYKKNIRICTYRPFCKLNLYFSKEMNWSRYLQPKFFPSEIHKNLLICVTGNGGRKDFACIMVNHIPSLDLLEKVQCFPLHWYDDGDADVADLFNQGAEKPMDRYVRKDGVTDWILNTARKQYGYKVTKEDIFYYVYGLLHSPDYRTAFATDLKKSLPRLPLVEKADDFWAFSKAGRELADLHLNYETIEPYRKCIVSFAPLTNKGDKMNYHVEKMRFGKIDSKTSDKSVIYYNNSITITGIPAEAYEYVVNGKSAIEWVMERYAIANDKKSGITNDPNDWAREHNDEKYILNLLLRVINVSVQTVEIVKGLPKLKFE